MKYIIDKNYKINISFMERHCLFSFSVSTLLNSVSVFFVNLFFLAITKSDWLFFFASHFCFHLGKEDKSGNFIYSRLPNLGLIKGHTSYWSPPINGQIRFPQQKTSQTIITDSPNSGQAISGQFFLLPELRIDLMFFSD